MSIGSDSKLLLDVRVRVTGECAMALSILYFLLLSRCAGERHQRTSATPLGTKRHLIMDGWIVG